MRQACPGRGDNSPVEALPDERDVGAAGVWVLCICALTFSFAVSVLAMGGAVSIRHRAATAADLAALAGAETLLAGAAQPCDAARRVAVAQGARLSRCVVEYRSVRVEAEVASSIGRLPLPPARARARAGAATLSSSAVRGAP